MPMDRERIRAEAGTMTLLHPRALQISIDVATLMSGARLRGLMQA